MKDYAIEQKAKAYDELIAKLIKAKEDDMLNDERYCCVIDEIVPELKESEDEKICRKLIAFLKQCKAVYGSSFKQFDIDIDNAITWLEKQGIFSKKDVDDAYLKGISDAKNELEKQSKETKIEQAMREVEEKAEAFTKAHKGETSEEVLAQMRGEKKVNFTKIIGEPRKATGVLKEMWDEMKSGEVEQKLNVGDRLKLNGIEDTPIVRIIESIEEKDGNYIYNLTDDGTNDTYDHWIEFKDKNWSVDDEMMVLGVQQVVGCASWLNIVPDKLDKINHWLKSLKDRIQCAYISQKNFNEVKEK